MRAEHVRAHHRAQKRITEYVAARWPSVRAAGEALGVDHSALWRAMKGHNVSGPGLSIVTALADHSGKSTDYFLGRGE